MSDFIAEMTELAEEISELRDKFSQRVYSSDSFDELIKLGRELMPHTELSSQIYSRAIELNPQSIDAITELASVYWLDGDDESARVMLKKAQKIDSSNVQTLILEAVLEVDTTKQKSLYLKILELEPGNEIARNNLANLEVADEK